MKHTYQSSGVDIKKGEELVEEMKEMVSSTYNDAVINPIGGFGGMFSASFKEMEDPVLVSSVDGVGTKLIVAFRAGVYDTVGQDLVNHCEMILRFAGRILSFSWTIFQPESWRNGSAWR